MELVFNLLYVSVKAKVKVKTHTLSTIFTLIKNKEDKNIDKIQEGFYKFLPEWRLGIPKILRQLYDMQAN